VVYEPNYAGKEVQLAEALAVTHVLKFSRERLPHLASQELPGPELIVETMGADGLRYLDRRRGADWQTMRALRVSVVRDSGGSGDWTTAGLIHCAGQGGYAGFAALNGVDLYQALRFGQALGAWNCAFVGARGGVYHADAQRWRGDVRRVLSGEVFDPLPGCHDSTHDEAGRFCPRCGGGPR
jgi:fructokinase